MQEYRFYTQLKRVLDGEKLSITTTPVQALTNFVQEVAGEICATPGLKREVFDMSEARIPLNDGVSYDMGLCAFVNKNGTKVALSEQEHILLMTILEGISPAGSTEKYQVSISAFYEKLGGESVKQKIHYFALSRILTYLNKKMKAAGMRDANFLSRSGESFLIQKNLFESDEAAGEVLTLFWVTSQLIRNLAIFLDDVQYDPRDLSFRDGSGRKLLRFTPNFNSLWLQLAGLKEAETLVIPEDADFFLSPIEVRILAIRKILATVFTGELDIQLSDKYGGYSIWDAQRGTRVKAEERFSRVPKELEDQKCVFEQIGQHTIWYTRGIDTAFLFDDTGQAIKLVSTRIVVVEKMLDPRYKTGEKSLAFLADQNIPTVDAALRGLVAQFKHHFPYYPVDMLKNKRKIR